MAAQKMTSADITVYQNNNNDSQDDKSPCTDAMHQVLNYDDLLEEIMMRMSLRDINICKATCSLWFKVASDVDKKRRKIESHMYPFRIPKFEGIHTIPNIHMIEWLSYDKNGLYDSLDDVESSIIKNIRKSYADPCLMILTEGNNSKIGKKRRWKRAKVINSIRSKLPPSTRVIGVDSHYGIIGHHPIHNLKCEVPLVHSYFYSNTFCVSSLMIPKFKGVVITVIDRNSEFSEDAEYITEIPTDLKSLIILSSGVGYSGEFLDVPNINFLMEKMSGQVAVAGAQINDRLEKTLVTTSFADDTANFYFKNGHPPYNPMYNPQKVSLIGILFSGPNIIFAASTVIQSSVELNGDTHHHHDTKDDLKSIKSQLMKFKHESGLCDVMMNTSDGSIELLSFVFFNYNKMTDYMRSYPNQLNPAIGLFQEILGVKFKISFGLLTHAQYGYNYWPSKHVTTINDHMIDPPSLNTIASIAVICIKKT